MPGTVSAGKGYLLLGRMSCSKPNADLLSVSHPFCLNRGFLQPTTVFFKYSPNKIIYMFIGVRQERTSRSVKWVTGGWKRTAVKKIRLSRITRGQIPAINSLNVRKSQIHINNAYYSPHKLIKIRNLNREFAHKRHIRITVDTGIWSISGCKRDGTPHGNGGEAKIIIFFKLKTDTSGKFTPCKFSHFSIIPFLLIIICRGRSLEEILSSDWLTPRLLRRYHGTHILFALDGFSLFPSFFFNKTQNILKKSG